MKKYTSLILVVSFLISSCSMVQRKDKLIQDETSGKDDIALSRRRATELEIQNLLEDDSFYWGRGTADIGDSYSEARQQAKENAIRDLSGRIRTEVTTELKRTISNVATYDTRRYTEQEQQIIEERSRIYTDIVLSGVQWDRFFEEYPHPRVIKCLVRKSKQEYDEQVSEELRNNKQMISGFIQTGNRDFKAGRHLNAVHSWTTAKEWMNNIFGGLPLMHDISGDGRDEELNSYLNERIINFFSDIRFSLADDTVIAYDAQGNITTRPVIMANYIGREDIKQPVSSLPLRINTIEGSVRLPIQVETGVYGQYELNISNLDASYAATVIRVDIDTDRIDKLNLYSLPLLNSLTIRLERMKTMAISVTFVNGSSIATPGSLLASLKRTAIQRGFSVTEISIRTDKLTAADTPSINNTNADYLLNVYLIVSDVQSVGGYDNAFNARCSGSINLYRLPGIDNNIASEPLRAEQGFGASAVNAGVNAYSSIVPAVERHVERIISGL